MDIPPRLPVAVFRQAQVGQELPGPLVVHEGSGAMVLPELLLILRPQRPLVVVLRLDHRALHLRTPDPIPPHRGARGIKYR
jgi:hypothetical protein